MVLGNKFSIYLIIIMFILLIFGVMFGVWGVFFSILIYVFIKVVVKELFDWYKVVSGLYIIDVVIEERSEEVKNVE